MNNSAAKETQSARAKLYLKLQNSDSFKLSSQNQQMPNLISQLCLGWHPIHEETKYICTAYKVECSRSWSTKWGEEDLWQLWTAQMVSRPNPTESWSMYSHTSVLQPLFSSISFSSPILCMSEVFGPYKDHVNLIFHSHHKEWWLGWGSYGNWSTWFNFLQQWLRILCAVILFIVHQMYETWLEGSRDWGTTLVSNTSHYIKHP